MNAHNQRLTKNYIFYNVFVEKHDMKEKYTRQRAEFFVNGRTS